MEDLVNRISTFSVEMQTTVVALSRTDCYIQLYQLVQ